YSPRQQAGLAEINGLGLMAAYYRLGGRSADFEATVRKIHEYAGSSRRDTGPLLAAKALLINEQPQAALGLLVKYGHSQPAAEILLAQGDVAQALHVSERAAKAEVGQNFHDRPFHIELLRRLGKVGEAKEWLSRLVKDMEASPRDFWRERRI